MTPLISAFIKKKFLALMIVKKSMKIRPDCIWHSDVSKQPEPTARMALGHHCFNQAWIPGVWARCQERSYGGSTLYYARGHRLLSSGLDLMMFQLINHSSPEVWLISALSRINADPHYEGPKTGNAVWNHQTKVTAGWDWGALMEQWVRSWHCTSKMIM